MVARAQHGQQRGDGRHAGGERMAAHAALERGQRGLQVVAGGVAGARIVPAAVGADAGEFKGGRKIERYIYGASLWIRMLARVNGKGRVSVFGHRSASRLTPVSSLSRVSGCEV